MKNEQGVSTSGEKKSNLGNRLWWAIIIVVSVVLGMVIMTYLTPANPLQQYLTERTCNFVSMGDFSTAVCTDGTAWNVSPFQK